MFMYGKIDFMGLKAVIYEGMRMVPPVINGFEKTVPPGGDTSESCLSIKHSVKCHG